MKLLNTIHTILIFILPFALLIAGFLAFVAEEHLVGIGWFVLYYLEEAQQERRYNK